MTSSPIIEVSDLTKRYIGRTAVDNISFSVGPGEVVGLLGPNGAGKSTILKILAGYMPATAGTVRVAGFDVFHESEEVRKRIGYMPEHNPLHLDMRVREYLKFRARLKGLSRSQTRDRVAAVTEQCGLEDVSRRIIGQLSKGYRQRVGLADALVHEPELIILDEPTIGLDPNQIRAVRLLVKQLGGKQTILLSTHILPEVEMTCSRIIILHEGRILAADTTENLQATFNGSGLVIAEIAAPADDLMECWREMEFIEHFDVSPAEGEFYRCALTPRNGIDIRPMIYQCVKEHGWALRELTRSRHSLEDVFVHIIRGDQEETF
jgi:ABC-2 type transport system ATP-binding protein